MKKEIDKIAKWIEDYVKQAGAKGIVIGNSGGKDSAAVIGLCCKAIGNKNVITVSMPCSSNEQDYKDALLVANTFKVPLIKIDLTMVYNKLLKEIELCSKKHLKLESKINIRPRLRMTTLYALAKDRDYLVAGTGNLCEIMIGYTTKWGDSACDFNPLAEFTVEEVLEIDKILGVPAEIINEAPNDGLGTGTDEEKIGIKYSLISEYIKTGTTENEYIDRIEKMITKNKHKREKIPIYHRNKNKF